MIKKCYAKINLALDILGQRSDGYHEIDTIMTRIDLFDKLFIEKTNDNKFHYEANIDLGDLEDNLIYKAYKLISPRAKNKGIRVRLEKNIPLAAGLAGGSTDAAEMIKGLNELWDLGLSKKEMMDIGLKLGADVPFFFLEESARARGVGEKLEAFSNKTDLKILLINDGPEIPSSYVYERTKHFGHIDMDKIVSGLRNSDNKIVEEFENVMEDVVCRDFPKLMDIKEKLLSLGAKKALVSGSGASVFGIFFDENDLEEAYQSIKDSYRFVKKVELIDD
uniref:4-(cytidine 5'-diphospho)-2-C-methyl-D-erythritol kinase n=1 Tax=Anaerococcus mediterraneensis TaxID=1870984 RepID=UPI00092FE466|nr:4-(cytidine 5'-diphospho)-2-C-methyl-D-erythritol kinase [Anaerococcus mediterraneensis]